VIVLQIEGANAAAFNGEGQPPIAADRDAPCSGAVAFQLMDAPTRWPDNLGYVLGDDQRRENVAQPFCQVWAKLSGVVIFDEAQKPSMLNASDPHAAMYGATVQASRPTLKGRVVCKSSFVPKNHNRDQ
jgi:hypothetical protein